MDDTEFLNCTPKCTQGKSVLYTGDSQHAETGLVSLTGPRYSDKTFAWLVAT
jgi:hypothetical protein